MSAFFEKDICISFAVHADGFFVVVAYVRQLFVRERKIRMAADYPDEIVIQTMVCVGNQEV